MAAKHKFSGDWTGISTWATVPPSSLLSSPSLTLAKFPDSPYATPAGTPMIPSAQPAAITQQKSGKGFFKSSGWGLSGASKSTDSLNSSSGAPGTITFTDVNPAKEEVTVAGVEKQGEWESRRLWKKVAKGIRESDFASASTEKTAIEEAQRAMRKAEREEGRSWELKHFDHLEADPLCEYQPFFSHRCGL